MTTKAFDFAKRVMSKQFPAMADNLSLQTVTQVDGRSLGFVTSKNITLANSIFYDLNQKEKLVREKIKDSEKKLGAFIPWNYFYNSISDKALVDETKQIYDKIFTSYQIFPELETFVSKPNNQEVFPGFETKLNSRIGVLEKISENEINPLLNPFADFWTYQMDGPEFKDIFAARPMWNEVINRAADEFAFVFQPDAVLNKDVRNQMTAAIHSKLADFLPKNENFLEVIEDVANGKINTAIVERYNDSVKKAEDDVFNDIISGDNSSVAMRNGFISGESDPNGKLFGGH